MAKQKKQNAFGDKVVIKRVSGGTSEGYIGKTGVIVEEQRGVFATLMEDKSYQYFFGSEFDKEGADNE